MGCEDKYRGSHPSIDIQIWQDGLTILGSVQHQHRLLIAMRQFHVILIIFIIHFTYISSDQNNDIANKRSTHLTHFGLSVPGPFLHDRATLPSGPDRGHRLTSQFTIEIMALGIQLVNNDNQNNGPLALLMITPLCCHDGPKKPAFSYPAVNASEFLDIF